MLENAARICEATFGNLYLHKEGGIPYCGKRTMPADVIQSSRKR